jgi:hypothetical protein
MSLTNSSSRTDCSEDAPRWVAGRSCGESMRDRPASRVLVRRLRGGLIAHLAPDAETKYLVILGIRCMRTMKAVTRSLTWGGFGWYGNVLVDLTDLDEWSPPVVDWLSDVSHIEQSSGRWLGFYTPRAVSVSVNDCERIHLYYDHEQARAAMETHRN